ncbi:MAG: hypothetical protein LBB68_02650 [Treponema sp.]|jgi:hypothetical protein|nr:hypothetical protein [Treponema sp.]
MVSMYGSMKDEELDALHAHFTRKYGGQMLDESRPVEERHLGVLVDQNYRPRLAGSEGPPPPANGGSSAKTVAGMSSSLCPSAAAELRSAQECAKEVLYRQLKNLSLAMYLCMDKNKDWGSMGKQRVSLSLCRNILKIPNNREVIQLDADRFFRIVDEQDAWLGRKSGDEMARYCKEKTVSLFGKDFYWFSELREFVKLFDAEYYFYSYAGSYGAEFIFGAVSWTQIDDTPIYTFLDEYTRSPSNCLSIAGRSPSPMQIRKVSLEVIFFNKWEGFFRRTKAAQRRCLRHPNSAIRESLKERALTWYEITDPADLLRFKDKVLNNMGDGVIWHEFGHQISQRDMIPVHWALRGNIRDDETVSCALEELLAEWAPVRGGKKGAVIRFLEIADSDSKAASGLFYTFLSDNWYVDEEEEFLSLRSNSYLGLGLYFIEPDGSVNFDRMAREHGRIYGFLLDKFRRVMERLLDFLSHATFVKDGRLLCYDEVEAENLKSRQEKNAELTVEKIKEYDNYWKDVLACLKASESEWKRFQDLIAQESALLEHDILALVTGGNTMQYINSLRSFIIDRCRKIGIYNPPNPTNIKKAVQKASEKLGVPQKKITQIYNRFDRIMNGEVYEADIKYDGPPDPFIYVLQEMMLETGMGAILSGMFLGKWCEPEERRSLRRYIKNELEDLRNQIENEMYQQVDLLRVNKRYADPSLVKGILKGIKFYDGGSLEDKIKAVEPASFDNEALLEAFIPLRRGYMDWDTIEAVWRINQDLRPDEFMLQWSIDRNFLEALVEVYAE